MCRISRGGYSRNTNVGILWGADIALVTCGFIAIGHKVLKNSKLSMKKYVIIIFLIIGVILSCQNGKHVEMAHSYYGNSYILFYITALLNCFTICIVAKWVQRSKVLVYIGKNTLFIMCVHYIIYDFTVPIVKMLIAHISFPQIFGSLLNCILTFMLICPLMYAREKIVELYKN